MGAIRSKLSYANVMATVAVFLALGGGATAALKLNKNSVGSKQIKKNAVQGAEAKESSFGQVPSAAAAVTATTATTATTANGVAPDSVGAAGIQNPIRSISLPLGSFVNVSDAARLSFTPSNGTSPDLAVPTGDLVIEWDDDTDGGGGDVGDFEYAESSFVVPADYASGGQFVLTAAKDGHSGVGEAYSCYMGVNGSPGPFTGGTTSSAALTQYTVSPSGTPAAGSTVQVGCTFHAASGPLDGQNDVVWLYGVAFRYTATQ